MVGVKEKEDRVKVTCVSFRFSSLIHAFLHSVPFIIIKLEKETHVPFISLTLVPQPMIDSRTVVCFN